MDTHDSRGSHFPGGHGDPGAGWTDGTGGADPADSWVLDPVTGEYRLRLPGERPSTPAGESAGHPGEYAGGYADDPSWQRKEAPADRTAELSVAELLPARVELPPASRSRAASRANGGGSRRGGRRRNSGTGGGLWLAGTLAVVGLVGCGAGGYMLMHHGDTQAAACTAAKAPASAAPDPQLSGKPLPPGPDAQPINVRVTVLNGSGVFGQAESVLAWMQNKQLYLRTSNGGPAKATAITSLVYAPNHVDQARTLAAAMHLPPYTLHGTGTGTGLRDPMILTLGKDFKAPGEPLTPPVTPTPTASRGGSGHCGG